MKIILILIILHLCSSIEFEEAMNKLEVLENYIRQYIEENKNNSKNKKWSHTELVTTYIRKGNKKYNNTFWNLLLFNDNYPDDFEKYIIEKQKKNNINITEIRTYGEIKLPNKETFDFAHFFATMDGINFLNIYRHLMGWGGDTATLVRDIIKEKGTLEELVDKANEFFNHKGSFGPADLISDLDAPIILKKKKRQIIFQN